VGGNIVVVVADGVPVVEIPEGAPVVVVADGVPVVEGVPVDVIGG